MCLALGRGPEFEGHVEVRFVLAEKSDALYLDFGGDEVGSIEINGKRHTGQELFYRHHVRLPLDSQIIGANIVFTVCSQ